METELAPEGMTKLEVVGEVMATDGTAVVLLAAATVKVTGVALALPPMLLVSVAVIV